MNNILKYEKNQKIFEVNLCKSAPNQIQPTPVIYDLIDYWKNIKRYKEIIDIGCGKLRNSLLLVKYFSLWLCDFNENFENKFCSARLKQISKNKNFQGIITPDEFKKGKLKADAGFICFVLHTIPEVKLRQEIIFNTIRNLKKPYKLFISVPNGERYYRDRMSEDNRFLDGYIFNTSEGQKTFYKDFDAEEIDTFMKDLGFIVECNFPHNKKNSRVYSKE